MNRATKCISVLAMSAWLVTTPGCGTAQPIVRWQERLTDFTVKQGHGDPNILRDSAELRSPRSLRPAQIRFSEDDIAGPGIPPFVTRRDVHGVLLGQHDGTFLFLLGVVRRPQIGAAQVEDVRLSACNLVGNEHQCQFSEPDPQALQQYLSIDDSSGNERVKRHPVHRTFPLLDDDFRLEVRDGLALATDERSGAVWRLRLDDQLVAHR